MKVTGGMRYPYTGNELRPFLDKALEANRLKLDAACDKLRKSADSWRNMLDMEIAEQAPDNDDLIALSQGVTTAFGIVSLHSDGQFRDYDDLEQLAENVSLVYQLACKRRAIVVHQTAMQHEIIRNPEIVFELTAAQLALLGVIPDICLQDI